MKEYEVTTSTWLEDAEGIGALRNKGDKITLTENQARGLKLTRQIKDVTSTSATKPTVKPPKPKED